MYTYGHQTEQFQGHHLHDRHHAWPYVAALYMVPMLFGRSERKKCLTIVTKYMGACMHVCVVLTEDAHWGGQKNKKQKQKNAHLVAHKKISSMIEEFSSFVFTDKS